MLFENMGHYYLGPVDGHNMRQMMKPLMKAKRIGDRGCSCPWTKKGRGYEPAKVPIRTGFMEQVLLILKQAGYFEENSAGLYRCFFQSTGLLV